MERRARGRAGGRPGQARWWGVLPLGVLLGACAAGRQEQRYDDLYERLSQPVPEARDPAAPAGARTSGQAGAARNPDTSVEEPLFGGAEVLDRTELVRLVLARNPDVEAARQAARASLARYRQATALPDPTAQYELAPLSIDGRGGTRFGQRISLSQRFPWPGTLSARGDVVLAEAEAEAELYQVARLELALAAARLFDSYYANARSLELIDEHEALVTHILEAARSQYQAGLASQQDPLQAEVELAHVEHRRLILEHQRDVLVAQINALLHRAPHLPLPPAPSQIDVPLPDVRDSEELQRIALEHRPEMEAVQARLRARRAAIEAAELDYWPGFGVMGSYNSMWRETAHQWMVGVSVDIPIQLGRREAAVAEARARLAAEEARVASLAAEIRTEVEEARHQVIEAKHVVSLYRSRLLPAARQQIEAARIAYSTGRGGFQALIDAERTLRSIELQYQEALAALEQREAELARSLGRLPAMPETEEEPALPETEEGP